MTDIKRLRYTRGTGHLRDLSLIVAGCLLAATANSHNGRMSMNTIEQTPFGTLQDGRAVTQYTLSNGRGLQVDIINYGGIVTAVRFPDRDGRAENVVLGFDSIDKYQARHPFFGALIGRYANRIEAGRFSIDGDEYELATNLGNHHLHGGYEGFDRVLWEARPTDDNALQLTYHSPDGEAGYPGNLDVTVVYSVTADNALEIVYQATTDKPTLVNLTNHSYFNLSGNPENTVLDQELQIDAEHYTPVDDEAIPTGGIAPVKDTPFDFTRPHTIGERIEQVAPGYDHNFVLSRAPTEAPRPVATLYSPESGRRMTVSTTEPGMQLFTANHLDGSLSGPDGTPFGRHSAVCLETQHFPNSPNEPDFPSTVLRPGETYRSTTEYRFSIR